MLVGGLTIAFLPMYYFFPDVDVSVREVLPGVLVAAVGWAALQSLFQVYVALSSSSDSAGPIGAILLLLTWLYFGGLILLVGAVVNATRSGHIDIESDALGGSPANPDRDPVVDADRRERERLAARFEDLRRERDQLRNDRDAERARRYRLEDRVADLDDRVEQLETTNRDLEGRSSDSAANSRPARGRRGAGGCAARSHGFGR